jgi:hypothetical protein
MLHKHPFQDYNWILIDQMLIQFCGRTLRSTHFIIRPSKMVGRIIAGCLAVNFFLWGQLLLHFLTDLDEIWHKARWWCLDVHEVRIFRFVNCCKSYGPWHLRLFLHFFLVRATLPTFLNGFGWDLAQRKLMMGRCAWGFSSSSTFARVMAVHTYTFCTTYLHFLYLINFMDSNIPRAYYVPDWRCSCFIIARPPTCLSTAIHPRLL